MCTCTQKCICLHARGLATPDGPRKHARTHTRTHARTHARARAHTHTHTCCVYSHMRGRRPHHTASPYGPAACTACRCSSHSFFSSCARPMRAHGSTVSGYRKDAKDPPARPRRSPGPERSGHATRVTAESSRQTHHVMILGRGSFLLPLFAHVLLHAPPHFPQFLGDLHHRQLRVGVLDLLSVLVGKHYEGCSWPLGRTLPASTEQRRPPAHGTTHVAPRKRARGSAEEARRPRDSAVSRDKQEGSKRAASAHGRPSSAGGDAPRPLPAYFASCAC